MASQKQRMNLRPAYRKARVSHGIVFSYSGTALYQRKLCNPASTLRQAL